MFVGRVVEKSSALATLGALPSSVAVTGPPGIGKTTFCEVLSEELRDRGTPIAWGRAWELGGAPPFFPWQRVFSSIGDHLGTGGAPFREMSDVLLEGGGEVDTRARLKLFERVRELFASLRLPLVVVLDDIHAADVGSLQIARYLQRELRGTRVGLLLATRDVAIETAEEGAQPLLRDLLRNATRTIALSGLAEGELDEWLPWFCGRQLPAGLPRRLVSLTGGNPFFVRELIEAQHGDLESITEDRPGLPRAIRDVIERQVSQLDPTTQAVLRIAAVFGRESKVADLARVLGLPLTDVDTARQRALDARLVTSSPKGEMRFAHALVCETLYATTPTDERLTLHAAVVDVLAPSRLSERTRHAIEAALLDEKHATRALALCREAGDVAYRTLAFEEAASYHRNALVFARQTAASATIVAETSLALGEALAAMGERAAAEHALGTAAALADELSDVHLFARTALARAGMREYVRREVANISVLETALEKLGAEESDLTARVLARLASDLVMDPSSRERRAELAARAIAIAKRVGRPETIALALEARLQCTYGPATIEERLLTSDEIVTHARSRGDIDRELGGRAWKLSALLERGDVLVALPLANEYATLAETRRSAGPRINAQSRLATLAFLRGRFEEGIAHVERAFEIGTQAGDGGASLLRNAQLVLPSDLRGERGPLEGALEVLAREAHHVTHRDAIKALRTLALISLGRHAEARAELVALGLGGFDEIAQDFTRVGTLCALADALVRVGDVGLASALRPLLLPHAARNAMIGTAACLGAVSRYVGRIAALLGDEGEAIEHLEMAREANARMGARPWLAWSELELAEVLARRGDGERATAMLDASRATAMELGMTPLVERIDATAGPSARPPESPTRTVTLRREARGWSLDVGAKSLPLPDRRGIGYLARLVAVPGREIHALELVAPEGELLPREGGSDEVLDASAKASIRAHLVALNADIAEAERGGDDASAARARAELEAVEEHLAASLGPRGRSRRHGSSAEKARIAVTVALKRAVAEIGREAPEIAAHLERSLRTGLFCSYDPDPSATVRVTT